MEELIDCYIIMESEATQLKPTCKMCKNLAIIVQVPCITFLARLAESANPASARDMSLFLHNMQESCTSNSARYLPARFQYYTLQDEECKFLARKMYIPCTLLARNVYVYFHFLQGTMLKLHVSCKDLYAYCTLLARFVHEICHISCKEPCSNCTFLASILHVMSACILHVSCKDCIK